MSASAETDQAPWERPFWKPVPGKEAVFFHLILIHVLAVVGLILFPAPSLKIFLLALLFANLGGLGTTVCFHRALSHSTLKLHPVVEHFLIFWTVFNGSGNPISWAAYHRKHHAKSDTPEDISSPTWGGFWWSHLRWLYQTPKADIKRWAPDLDRPAYRFWMYLEVPMIALAILGGLAFGWEAFFWLGAIRLVYSLHMQCFVNSIMHMGSEDEGDSSRNLWWLGPLQLAAWGENWHRNHHSYANSAQFGLKWWQVDVGWYFIRGLEMVGLAKGVKRPNEKDQKRGSRRVARAAA